MSAPRVELVDLAALGERTRRDWERLATTAGGEGCFVTPEWLGAWHSALGAGWQPCAVQGVRDGRTMLIAPFGVRPTRRLAVRTLSFLGAGASDYLAPLADQTLDEGALEACLGDALDACPNWQVIDLPALPAESRVLAALVRALRARGLAVSTLAGQVCPETSLAGSWAQYLERRGGHFRHWLRRKRATLERVGRVEYRHVREAAEMPSALAEAVRLHRRRWRGRYTSSRFSASAVGERFYREMLSAYAERGWADLAFLELDRRPIAFAVSLLREGRWLYLVPAHDPAWDAFSPGGLLLAHLVETAHAEQRALFDFGIGDESYKLPWATRQRRTLRLLAAAPGSAGHLALAVSRARQRLRSYLRGNALAQRARDRLGMLLRDL